MFPVRKVPKFITVPEGPIDRLAGGIAGPISSSLHKDLKIEYICLNL